MTQGNGAMPILALLRRDLLEAARSMGREEARYLVDYYYAAQDNRKAARNQERALNTSGEPNQIIGWLGDVEMSVEDEIRRVLDVYSDGQEVGRWSKGIIGIGPVISAGLLAYVDIARTPTVSALWSLAGQNPTQRWEKGQKRPWNASLKVLCWKIGESFVKTCNHEKSIYGPIYIERKLLEAERNDAGLFAEQAAEKLRRFRIGEDALARKHYEAGKLPPAHIHARAKRYATKMFLSHWWETAYRAHFGTEPPRPWVIEHGGHVDYVGAPT